MRKTIVCAWFARESFRVHIRQAFPMDDRIILHDIDGNGLPEAFIPDSGNGAGNSKFVWIRFGWRTAKDL